MMDFTLEIPTRIHFGRAAISNLTELKDCGEKVLLVYGGGSIKKNGIYDNAINILKEADLQIFELSGVEPNPRIDESHHGELFFKGKC